MHTGLGLLCALCCLCVCTRSVRRPRLLTLCTHGFDPIVPLRDFFSAAPRLRVQNHLHTCVISADGH